MYYGEIPSRCRAPLYTCRPGFLTPPAFGPRTAAVQGKSAPLGLRVSRRPRVSRTAASCFVLLEGFRVGMFESLSTKLGSVFDKLRGRGALHEELTRDVVERALHERFSIGESAAVSATRHLYLLTRP